MPHGLRLLLIDCYGIACSTLVLRDMQRLMAYCRALRQPAALRQRMAIEADDLLMQVPCPNLPCT